MRVAEQFHTAAGLIEEFTGDPAEDTINNAYVTLCVHAGIASADVICCARLGEYSRGEDHKEAVALLSRVDKSLGTVLARLLALKTPAGYQPRTVSRQHVTTAGRQADQLIAAARAAG
ncbi:hypothetical protein GCM10009745_62210 [Kribbella yunnanensis]|uniref:Uncharacterized protein n=1 Tax=Kribbella yunnanensis TaxID=190194 RepID=A0ABP4UHZ6_9ACTN